MKNNDFSCCVVLIQKYYSWELGTFYVYNLYFIIHNKILNIYYVFKLILSYRLFILR